METMTTKSTTAKKTSLSLSYEGLAEFSYSEIWVEHGGEYVGLCARISDALRTDAEKSERMRCRIQLTIERLPDDKLEMEVV